MAALGGRKEDRKGSLGVERRECLVSIFRSLPLLCRLLPEPWGGRPFRWRGRELSETLNTTHAALGPA